MRNLPQHMTPQNDLVGKKFGYLTVLYLTKIGTKSFWVCRCDCGKLRNVERYNLTRKRWPTKHCGCKTIESDPYVQIVKYLFRQYKHHRTRERGLDFHLKLEDFLSLCAEPCFYCGGIYIRTYFEPNYKRTYSALANGLDRIDSYKGYSLDNVVPCCSDCNYAKRSLGQNEFLQLIEKIALYQEIIR